MRTKKSVVEARSGVTLARVELFEGGELVSEGYVLRTPRAPHDTEYETLSAGEKAWREEVKRVEAGE